MGQALEKDENEEEEEEEEEAAAEAAARALEDSGELAAVGEHYREMTRKGAQVKGEGEIEPPPRDARR